MAVDRLRAAEGAALTAADREEFERLRDFFDSALIGLHYVAPDGTILRANRADYESLGYSEEEYVGHNIAEFHADQGAIAEILARLSRGEDVSGRQARLRCKDGEIREVVINANANVVDGTYVNSRWLTRDFTDENRARLDTRLSEERYGALVRLLPALIVITTGDGEIDDVSESYVEYTGLTLELAKNWQEHQVIHPDDVEQSMQKWMHALATGEPMQNEFRLRRHDGIYRWFLIQAVPLRDERGNMTRWMTVNIDIEDRKRTEEHERYLAEATAKLVSPLDSPELLANIARLAVPRLADICSIGFFDASSHTARVETATADESARPHVDAVHLRGWRSAPGSHRTIGEVVGAGEPVFMPGFTPAWIDACAPTEEQRQVAMRIAPISLACVPMLAKGEPVGMATFATTTRSGRRYTERDFTLLTEVAARLSIALENSRLIADLRAANAAKDEFLGLVSHELKTPLTTIQGNASILFRNETQLSADVRRGALSDIVLESERLHRLIENLLLLARVEQGEPLEHEPLLVIRVVQRVIARYQYRNPSRRFDIVEKGSPNPVNAAADYLEQVIENLVSNAEKYSPPTAPIRIEIERTDREVRIRVIDEGVGIRDEDADKLFQPFFRSPATRARAGGLGIGLAVCRRLVEAQNGRIWAHRREGGGSEFGFALPIIEDATD